MKTLLAKEFEGELWVKASDVHKATDEEIKAEREACANVCDEKALEWASYYRKQYYAAIECASSIRARGNT